MSAKLAIGLDFGTESVRALIVDLNGVEVSSGVANYTSGQILEALPTGEQLPAHFALQDPADWVTGAAAAVQGALAEKNVDPKSIVGIGVDFTSCTMLPTDQAGKPLCQQDSLARQPHAWPKLWKHHGAQEQADRITQTARDRNEPFLDRYGGVIGLEWFFPKLLEVIENAPEIASAADIWLEAGDWFVWQLTGAPAESLPRSTCQAGYKAMWSHDDGYPSADFLGAVHPELAAAAAKCLPGKLVAPGSRAGELCPQMAETLGLEPGTPVSAAIIDAHAGVPGVGAEEGALVMVMGTSSCYMLNSKEYHPVTGVAGIVQDGILPGFFGYETGQAAVGDAFDWLRTLLGHDGHEQLASEAAEIGPGSDGIVAIDWMNGCRTPLMNGELAGAFTGLRLNHRPAHLYRALLEASAFGLRWIVESLEESGIPVRQLIATGGLPHHNPHIVRIYADVLGRPITIHPSKQGPALGSAILGALAAGKDGGGFDSPEEAIRAMATPQATNDAGQAEVVEPNASHAEAYEAPYARYRDTANYLANCE